MEAGRRFDVQLLGPLRVLAEGSEVAVPVGRQRALLAVLAVHVGESVSVDRLLEVGWGNELPEHPANSLQKQVSRLRRLLGREHLLQRGAGYVLSLAPEVVDTRRFEDLASRGQQLLGAGRPSEARSSLQEALALWRGGALEDFSGVDWADDEARRLDALRLCAVEDRVEAELHLGHHGILVVELEELVARHPFRERLRGQLMRALYRQGRQAQALEVFAQGRQQLADELGLEPGVELRELQAAILAQDPRLREAGARSDIGPVDVIPGVDPEPAPPPPNPRLRLLIVDDDPLVRSAVRAIVDTTDDLVVVGEAEDGADAVRQATHLLPDLVLIDVRMPRLDGIEATRRMLREIDPAPSVIVLTTFDQDEQVVRALEAGASGFVLKRSDPAKLPDAIRTVARGDAIVDPAVTRRLLTRFVSPTTGDVTVPPHESLDATEMEVLTALAGGESDVQIATKLAVPQADVAAHVQTILETLQVRDRTQAVVYAFRHGVVSADA